MKYTDYTVTYAQNREDLIIDGFFKGRNYGVYVDVGAGNPDIDSVTKLFYQKGWSGINIEPIGHIFKALQKYRKRDKNLNIGVSNKPDQLSFREYASDGFSTFSKDMHSQYQDSPSELTKKFIDYTVEVRTLKDIFTELEMTNIQFLKVDVEGYEYEVLIGNDWTKFRPELLCIEANHVKHDWRPLLLKHKYTNAYFDGLNEYYIANESSLPKVFPYVESIIDKEPIVNYRLQSMFTELERLEGQVVKQDKHVEYLERSLADAEKRLADAEKRLVQINSVPKHIKTSVKSHLKSLIGGDGR